MRFSEIFGHDREIDLLKRAIASNRVPHAYIFAGVDGIGKKLVAKALAATLNCASPVESDACGRCSDCEAFKNNAHENLIVIGPDEKGYLKIEQVRDAQRAQRLKVGHGARVIVVDSAEVMQAPAQNAFLKTLEEPVKGTMLVLVTSRPAALLPTILSRCQRVNFSPLAEDALKKALVKAEGLDEASAAILASYGMGSFSRAAAALKDGTFESGIKYIERLTALGTADMDVALKLAHDLSKDDFLQGGLEFIKTWLRDEALRMEGAGHLVAAGAGAEVWSRAGRAGFKTVSALFAAVSAAQRDVAPPRNANKQLVMETLVMDFASAARAAGGF